MSSRLCSFRTGYLSGSEVTRLSPLNLRLRQRHGGKAIHIVCVQDLVSLILGQGNLITFLEIKNFIPFVICQAKYIKFFGPNTWERSRSNDSSFALYQLRLFRKNSRRFPFRQYSIIMQRFELLPMEHQFCNQYGDCRQFSTIILQFS